MIALMLVSESRVVKQLYQSYGKGQAIKYANQIATRICQHQAVSADSEPSARDAPRQEQKGEQLELD